VHRQINRFYLSEAVRQRAAADAAINGKTFGSSKAAPGDGADCEGSDGEGVDAGGIYPSDVGAGDPEDPPAVLPGFEHPMLPLR
jgi:hypothetical protein